MSKLICFYIGLLFSLFFACEAFAASGPAKSALRAGFAEADITPKIGKRPVYIAGFGQNRIAEKIHDPLTARVVVFQHGSKKIALVSVDLVGLFLEFSDRVRRRLPGFDYVMISATHNHEGPDTLGLWGPNPFKSGVDSEYLKSVESQIVRAVKDAEKKLTPVTGKIGSARAPELLHDSREPFIKHDELVALVCRAKNSRRLAGIVVQWNCHPETLGSRFKKISADFVGPAVAYLKNKYRCPVVYFTGTVGGLMTSLRVPVRSAKGELLRDGTVEKTNRYGVMVGKLAEKAISAARPIQLTPLSVRTKRIFVPIDNKLFVFGWRIGVLKRKGYIWQGDPKQAQPIKGKTVPKSGVCIQTEIGFVQLGQLGVAAIPGEIYPELVLGKVQNPASKGADFPGSAEEPAVYRQIKCRQKMLIGLANDEIGYIIPKRQWDAKSPFCYGRKTSQYGEVNSLGPQTAPILCDAFRALAGTKK